MPRYRFPCFLQATSSYSFSFLLISPHFGARSFTHRSSRVSLRFTNQRAERSELPCWPVTVEAEGFSFSFIPGTIALPPYLRKQYVAFFFFELTLTLAISSYGLLPAVFTLGHRFLHLPLVVRISR